MLVLPLGATFKSELVDGFYFTWHGSKTCHLNWSQSCNVGQCCRREGADCLEEPVLEVSVNLLEGGDTPSTSVDLAVFTKVS